MSLTTRPEPPTVEYPDSDGQPMAESREQYEAIVFIQKNLESALGDRALVAADNFIYPVEGRPTIVYAPDVYVAFGRPARQMLGSYKVWEQGGVFPQVIFEVLSPNNRLAEMNRKFRFYDRYGAEEYYVYDPHQETLEGWLREGDDLEEVPNMQAWVSPRLGVRFDMSAGPLMLYRPDGKPFRTFAELSAAERWERERADAATARADAATARADAMAAKLRALGLDPDAP